MRLTILILTSYLLLQGSVFAATLNFPKDVNGWSIFTPSADTKIVYVSNSGNNDTCTSYAYNDPLIGADPFNPAGAIVPCSTYAVAKTKTTPGNPDWILMKRGDTFYEAISDQISSGRSETEPMLISAYGSSGMSPLFKIAPPAAYAIRFSATKPYVVISGLSFYAYKRNPTDPDYATPVVDVVGLSISSGGSWNSHSILIEGCKFSFFANNTAQGENLKYLTMRRNVITDNYGTTAHAQGFYSADASNIILEENIFDHNGWYSQAGSGGVGGATVYNHNTYMANMKDVVVKDNISLRPSSIHNKFTGNALVAKGTNTGTGGISGGESIYSDPYQTGTYVITCITEVTNGGVFSVMRPDGTSLPDATVGVPYSNDITFTIADGTTADFVIGDSFTVTFTEGITQNIEVTNNLYVDGEMWLSAGGNSLYKYRFKNISVSNNIITNMNKSRSTNRTLAYGIGFQDWDGGSITNNYILHSDESNSVAFEHLGTSRNVSIQGNTIYDFKNLSYGLKIASYRGTNVTGFNFSNNNIQLPELAGYTIDALYDPAGKWSFSDNKYFSNRSDGTRFSLSGADMTDAQWVSATGDNSTFEEVTFPNPPRSIETYMASIGETPTIDAFIAKCREQDRYNWDSRFTAAVVNPWVKAGFSVPTPQTGAKRYRGYRFINAAE